MRKTTICLTVLAMLISLSFVNCAVADSYDDEKKLVAAQQKQYSIAQPIPHFDWSLERSLAIQLYESRNKRVATHKR